MKKMLKSSIKDQIRRARKGLNIFYYGKGKGKTTAAMGLVARAAGAGMNVHILQFVKAQKPKKGARLQSGEWPLSSEILFFEFVGKALAKQYAESASNKKNAAAFGKISASQSGAGFVGILGDKKERAVHIKEAKKGLIAAKKIIASDKYDLVVLDELVSALELNLISEKDILDLIKNRPKHLHLVYTGHDKFDKIIKASDLASEIKMIKHPYYKGILAQKGIDF
jgi:cob(I)alamin adenosyltransferase